MQSPPLQSPSSGSQEGDFDGLVDVVIDPPEQPIAVVVVKPKESKQESGCFYSFLQCCGWFSKKTPAPLPEPQTSLLNKKQKDELSDEGEKAKIYQSL